MCVCVCVSVYFAHWDVDHSEDTNGFRFEDLCANVVKYVCFGGFMLVPFSFGCLRVLTVRLVFTSLPYVFRV